MLILVKGDRCDNFCMHSGTCSIIDDNPLCHCLPGFNGTHCEITPCQKYDCYNGGNCEYLPNWPPEYAQCICPDEFVGPHCKIANKCQTENIDCGIHGKCVNDESDDGYTCYCQPGYTGDKCEKAHPCAGFDCQHDGHCDLDENYSPYCVCTYKYEGVYCEKEIECNLTCEHDGICAKDHNDDLQCFCPQGYSGQYCEHDACATMDCYNGGTCSIEKHTGTPKCSCNNGYNGSHCEENVCQGYTECISEGRHGMCKVSKEGAPVCICKNGWTGENCDKKIDLMIRHHISPKFNVIRRYKQPSKTR